MVKAPSGEISIQHTQAYTPYSPVEFKYACKVYRGSLVCVIGITNVNSLNRLKYAGVNLNIVYLLLKRKSFKNI